MESGADKISFFFVWIWQDQLTIFLGMELARSDMEKQSYLVA